MDIAIEIRSKCITLSKHTKLTQRQIAEECGISKSAVNKLIKLYKETGSILPQRLGKCGRKRKTTKKEDALLLRNSKIHPTKTSDDLQKDLAFSGTSVHASTVRRRLLEVGRKARRPVKKQLLTAAMKRKRIVWAKKYKGWTQDDWKNVLFSDESHFFVQGMRHQFVRRSDREPVSPAHIQQSIKHPVKQMFWGCFSFFGPGSLVPITGMMNSQKYLEILQDRMVPELLKVNGGNPIFQHDLAPCHTSKIVKQFFTDNKITVLDWPGNSPDINPIENLWSICKIRLRKMDCTTKTKLMESVIEVWCRDTKIRNDCKSLVESMPKRTKMLLQAKGGHIKY